MYYVDMVNGEDYTFNMQKFATKTCISRHERERFMSDFKMEASDFFIFKFSRNAAEPVQITLKMEMQLLKIHHQKRVT
jgi:hypothetical protein